MKSLKWQGLAVGVLILIVICLMLLQQRSSDFNISVPIPAASEQEDIYPETHHLKESSDLKISVLNPARNQKEDVYPEKHHLKESDINDVHSFVLFIGWPRSCHSIIGSMLDAHPNMIVAHEFFLFKKLIENQQLGLNRTRLYEELYNNSFSSIQQKGWRDSGRNEKGYDLSIDKSWQGRFTHLKVIGDKSGGTSVMMYRKDRNVFKRLYQRLTDTVEVPIKVLQVIRNPLDMIATVTLYKGSSVRGRKANATVLQKYKNFAIMKISTTAILNIARAIVRMISDVGLSPLEIHCEDLVADPAKTISKICRFLDVECSADYLQMCVDKTFKNVSESRHLVQWNPQTLPQLIDTLRIFPFFKKYNLTTKQITK